MSGAAVEQATHRSVARMIRAVLGRGDEPMTPAVDLETGEPVVGTVVVLERTGRTFEVVVTELPTTKES